MVSQALIWVAIGAAIDDGIIQNTGELFLWVGVVLVLGVAPGGLRRVAAPDGRHQLDERHLPTVQVVGHHVAATGTRVHRRDPLGRRREHGRLRRHAHRRRLRHLRTLRGRDRRVGRRLGHLALDVGRTRTHRPHRRARPGVADHPPDAAPAPTQAAQREAAGRLAALGADTVAGLRILRGVGGEEVFLANYSVRATRFASPGIGSPRPRPDWNPARCSCPRS